MGYMEARYGGTCRDCGYEISPGETIYWAGRGLSFHETCHVSRSHGEGGGEVAPQRLSVEIDDSDHDQYIESELDLLVWADRVGDQGGLI